MKIASGLATGRAPTAELASHAVRQAMERAELSHANSVLLFLTPEFAQDPQPAILAASRASNCTQVIGCSAVGIFTEEEWVLDTPAAAAMVFGDDVSLTPQPEPTEDTLLLSLAAPNAINASWINARGKRFGGISGDATGHGPFKVWCGGKVAASGRCENLIKGVRSVVGVSQGIRALTPLLEITQTSGHDILTLGNQPALNVLSRELPLEIRELDQIPLHLIMVGLPFGDPDNAIEEGRFRLVPLIATNADDRSVTAAARLSQGDRIFWAMRQPLAAEKDMRSTLDRLETELAGTPDFALLFPCMGRGPYFYGGVDRDLELVKQRFPGMPILGFYGNGEIAPLNGHNELFQYSSVLGLFARDV